MFQTQQDARDVFNAIERHLPNIADDAVQTFRQRYPFRAMFIDATNGDAWRDVFRRSWDDFGGFE